MNGYILDKLRADSLHLMHLSTNEEKIQHPGLRGRLRELLIDNILTPWLPPYVMCGTGTIIEAENSKRESTQDDVILFDKTLAPPILGSNNSREGIFLYNSVLARVEVKSTINRGFMKDFCSTSLEMSKLRLSVTDNFDKAQKITGAINVLFAFKSDADLENKNINFELKRLVEVMKEIGIDPLSGVISMICVVGKGFWKIGNRTGKLAWERLNSNESVDQIAWFVGCMSNSCFGFHIQRQGRDASKSLDYGIGIYLDDKCFTIVNIDEL